MVVKTLALGPRYFIACRAGPCQGGWDKHIVSSGCRDRSIWNHNVRVHNHKAAELSSRTNE
ncbi:hypothetical protein BGW39_005133, partial [Mortierella sp. 14UC]